MLDTILAFIPVLAFLGGMWIYRSKATKYEFDVAAALAIFGVAAKLGIHYFLGYDSILPNVALVVVGTLLFLVLVYSVGDKVSGENTIALSATLALAPWFAGVPIYVIGILLLIVRLALATMKTMGVDAKTLSRDVAYQTGMLEGVVPNLRNMDTSATSGKRVSVVPPLFIAFASGVLVMATASLL